MQSKESKKKSEVLLNCPFCGGEAEATFLCDGRYNTIKCKTHNCILNVPIPVLYETKEEAIKLWNTRKPMERIEERLKEEIELVVTQFPLHGKYIKKTRAIEIVKEEGGIE